MVSAAVAALVALQAATSWLVGTGRAGVWRLTIAVSAVQGAAAVLLGDISGPGRRGASAALVIGLATGLVLFAATRGFVALAVTWPRFRRAVADRYERARDVPAALALVLAVGVAVPGEELFWRGLVQGRLADATSPVAGLVLAWLGYVAVNVPSTSLPIVAAAIVGGAVWSWLAWLTGGILASLVSHGVWTGLMLAFPPGAGRERPGVG